MGGKHFCRGTGSAASIDEISLMPKAPIDSVTSAKVTPSAQKNRKIALDRGKARKRMRTAIVFHTVEHAIDRAEIEFGEIHILTKLEKVSDAFRELTGDT